MTDQDKPRRPVAGSRSAASRPRRIAGHGARDVGDTDAPWSDPEDPTAEQDPPPERTRRPSPAPRPPTHTRPGTGLLSSTNATKVLGGVAVTLVLLVVAEAFVFGWATWVHEDQEESVRAFDEPFEVGEAPVQIPLVDWRAANKAAADAVTEILTVNWKDYDENLEDAAGLLTDDFLEDYRNTARDSQDKFIDARTDYKIEVVGSSVIEATEDQVASLIFLNQTVNKGEGEDRTVPQVYQVRAKVRMVRTDSGWLLDQLQPF